jgi:hypothetical protein
MGPLSIRSFWTSILQVEWTFQGLSRAGEIYELLEEEKRRKAIEIAEMKEILALKNSQIDQGWTWSPHV